MVLSFAVVDVEVEKRDKVGYVWVCGTSKRGSSNRTGIPAWRLELHSAVHWSAHFTNANYMYAFVDSHFIHKPELHVKT